MKTLTKVAKGEDRIAFVGERLTFKVARTNPRDFKDYARDVLKHYGLKTAIDLWRNGDADDHQTLKNFLFHGIVANRRERRLAKRGDVVVPTLSLLGGLVNVQRTADTPEIPLRTVHGLFADHLGPTVTRLGHMLERPGNIGVTGGQVQFVDGGSRGLERLMDTRSEDVINSLEDIASYLGTQAIENSD